MEIVVNTVKRKQAKSANSEDAKKPFVARSALDVQKLQLEKLMKDPDKPLELPKPRKEWKPRNPPEFVRHVMGSSAGAGSGEFHVYRGIRQRETKRNEWLEAEALKKQEDDKYHQKIEQNQKEAQERTNKLRAKRQKKKKNKAAKKESLKSTGKLAEREDTQKDEDDSPDEQGHVDEDHFVIGGK